MKVEEDLSFTLDLECYASSLSRFAKLSKLFFIFTHAQQQALREQAGKLLINSLLDSCNTSFYRRVRFELASHSSFNSARFNHWESENESKMNAILTVLESDLNSAKSAAIKESIRTGYLELGLHYMRWGRLEEAVKALLKCREFSSSPAQHAEVNLNVAACSMELGQFLNAVGFAAKLLEGAQDSLSSQRARALMAILALRERQWSSAANRLLELDQQLINTANSHGHTHYDHTWATVLSSFDVGLHAMVACLASMDRATIRERLLGNRSFAAAHLNHPLAVELKGLVQAVLGDNHFDQTMPLLRHLKSRLSLDPYLSSHCSDLLSIIEDKLLALYLQPFKAVSLSRLAVVLRVDHEELRTAIVKLISSRKVIAKLDFSKDLLLRRASASLLDGGEAASSGSSSSQLQRQAQLIEQAAAGLKRSLLLLSLRKHGMIVEGKEAMGGGAGAMMQQLGGGQAGVRRTRGGKGSSRGGEQRRTVSGNSGGNNANMMVDSDEEGADDQEGMMMQGYSSSSGMIAGAAAGGGGGDYYDEQQMVIAMQASLGQQQEMMMMMNTDDLTAAEDDEGEEEHDM